MAGVVKVRQRLGEFLLDRGEACGVGDFLSLAIRDVERVENLIEVRRDLGQFNREVQAVDRAADRVEQAGTIVREDADDVAAIGRIVVDRHSVGQFADRSFGDLPTEAARALEHLVDFELLAEYLADRLTDFVHTVLRNLTFEVGIADVEDVDNDAIGRCANLSGEDFQALRCERPGDAVKAAGGVLLVEHDAILDGVGLGVVLPLDDDLTRLQAADDFQIGRDAISRSP